MDITTQQNVGQAQYPADSRRVSTASSFRTLVAMQLREKADLSFTKNFRSFIMAVVPKVLVFVMAVAIFYGLFWFARHTGIFGHATVHINVLVLVFTIIMLLSISFTTNALTKALYLSFDNKILLTLPVATTLVFFSKLTVYYILEFRRSLTFVMPVFIGFGMIRGFSFFYYLLLPVSFLVISLLPVVVGAFLSIPLLYAIVIIRKNKILQLVLSVTTIILSVFFVFWLASLIPENFDFFGHLRQHMETINNFFANFRSTFFMFAWLVDMAVGDVGFNYHNLITARGISVFFGALAFALVCLSVAYIVVRPFYFKMATKSTENAGAEIISQKRNVKLTSFYSILKKELLLKFRTSGALAHTVFGVVFLPFAIYLLNRIYGMMSTNHLGDIVSLTTNFFIVILFVLTQNIISAAIFSREGKAVYIIKTTPDTIRANIIAKMLLDVALISISLLITVAIVASANNLPLVMSIPFFISVLMFSVGHICWSIQLDITNPQHNKIIDGVHETTNPNELISLAIALTISAIVSLAAVMFMWQDFTSTWVRILIVATIFVVLRIYLLIQNAKVYFKDGAVEEREKKVEVPPL
ncbi:MAG: hypothetical protein FWB72_06415 [Firmicutes bacterium]|nr:hypothetical protein [Bacillota bacterium]